MTKAELIARVAKSTQQSQSTTGKVVNALFQEVNTLLKKEDSIAFTGFGSFDVYQRAGRRGYNPQTGATIQIPPSKAVRFRPGKNLKALFAK